MKTVISTSFLLLLLVTIINVAKGKTISSNVDGNTIKSKKDQYYLIFTNNTAGEISIFDTQKIKKRQEIEAENFVFSLIDDIENVIIENKDTYKDQEKFEELEEETKLRKRDASGYNYGQSSFVYPISSSKDVTVLYGYFSDAVAKKISELDNVISCRPETKSGKYRSYFNSNDIYKQTKWKKFTYRKRADFHLSLISQGKYWSTLANKYDDYYYFPSSAGKDVDIIFIDSGFKFNFDEFTNYSERTTKCVGYTNEGKFKPTTNCPPIYGSHGQQASDAAAGSKHGVANKANVYGIGISVKYSNIKEGDVLAAFQYIKEKMVRPNKTIINISLIIITYKSDNFYIELLKLVNDITEKGGIIVAPACGSDEELDGDPGYIYAPCRLNNVICVSGLNNIQKKDFTKVYRKFEYSGYGKDVDIYAPMSVKVQYLNEKNKVITEENKGTSFSSAIVSGVIATYISENTNVKYTKDTMLKTLIKNAITFSHKKKTCYLINNGKHIVYSPDRIYHGCGIQAGNTPCKK
ncbi:hypothetical protein PIROE2DRAFT_6777 [Piromyces sp. E2]|nr:hypothetical protein PIROE2DRAFT_6777 [Piromyces sp. E2]|eukprot:OUM66068.1 hypothetical protein PIROE2DRAFT_6777 [Piromyces sp. E2]